MNPFPYFTVNYKKNYLIACCNTNFSSIFIQNYAPVGHISLNGLLCGCGEFEKTYIFDILFGFTVKNAKIVVIFIVIRF
jgi:hypothetical protein